MAGPLENLLKTQRRLNKRAKIKPRRAGVALYPIGLEREYARFLQQVVRFIREQIKLRLVPQLSGIQTRTQQARPDARQDAQAIDIGRIIDAIKMEVSRKYGSRTIEGMAKVVGESVSNHNRKQVKAQFERGIGVQPFLKEEYLAQELESFAFWNSRLVTNMSDQYLDQVQSITLGGFQKGESSKSMAEKIEDRFGVSKNRAKLIARDQVSSLNGQLSQLRQKEAGVTDYVWRTALDERVRPEHAAREGKKFSWSDPPEDGHPGEPINCRCTAEPVLDIADIDEDFA